MSYIIEHTTIAIDLWVILAFIALIAVIVFFLIRNHQMKKEEEELEDEINKYKRSNESDSATNY